MKKAFIFAFFLLSCTHWLIDTETRIRVKNSTNYTISDLSIVSSKSGEPRVLVPGTIPSGETSKVREVEWVGEFNFMIRIGDDWKHLGLYKLKGGSVLVEITENGGEFEMH